MNTVYWPSGLQCLGKPINVTITGADLNKSPQISTGEVFLQSSVAEGAKVLVNGFLFTCSNQAGAMNFRQQHAAFDLALKMNRSGLSKYFTCIATDDATIVITAKYPGTAFQISLDFGVSSAVVNGNITNADDVHPALGLDTWYELELFYAESLLLCSSILPIKDYKKLGTTLKKSVAAKGNTLLDVRSLCEYLKTVEPLPQVTQYIGFQKSALVQVFMNLYHINRDGMGVVNTLYGSSTGIDIALCAISQEKLAMVSSQAVYGNQCLLMEQKSRVLYNGMVDLFPISWAASGRDEDYPSGMKGQFLQCEYSNDRGDTDTVQLAETYSSGSGWAFVGLSTSEMQPEFGQVRIRLLDLNSQDLLQSNYSFSLRDLPQLALIALFENVFGMPEMLVIPIYVPDGVNVMDMPAKDGVWHTPFIDYDLASDIEVLARSKKVKFGLIGSGIYEALKDVSEFAIKPYDGGAGFDGRAFTIMIK